MFTIYVIGAVVCVLVAGFYCERHGVDTANIGGRIFLRSLFWPLFILNGVIWGLGMAIAVVYGHCIATAARERFRRK